MIEEVIKVKIDGWNTYNATLSKPTDLKTPRPLIIFLHGKGEAVDNLSAIYDNSNAGGPSYFIEHGQADYFKDVYVLSPQARGSGWSVSATQLDTILQDFIPKYNIDINRIYLTGLSAGGAGVVDYISRKFKYTAAAAIPMSHAASPITDAQATSIVANGTKIWDFCGLSDDLLPNNKVLVDKVNKLNPGQAKLTTYAGGHGGWGTFYAPVYGIYKWMLEQQLGEKEQPPGFIPPVRTVVNKLIITVYSNGDIETTKYE